MSFITNITTGQVQPFIIIRVDFQEAVIITEHPVENGSDISDHAQVRPGRFVIDCIVPESAFPNQPQGGVGPAIAWLQAALGQPLQLTLDNEGVFENLFIETAVHARTIIRERRFTIRAKEVRTVTVARGVITVDRTTNSGAVSRVEAGQQATEDAERDSSVLFRTESNLGAIGRALGF